MIQRIQTVFLLLAIILLAVTIFIPLASFQKATGEVVDISALSNTGLSIFVLGSSVVSMLLCAVSIFLYKTRKKQIILSYLALLPILLMCGYFIGYAFGLISSEQKWELSTVKGIILPVVSLVFILFAIKKIKADEKLVRSLDRIR